MYRLWLIFAQAATVAVAVLFVVSTFRPEWLPARSGAPALPASPPSASARTPADSTLRAREVVVSEGSRAGHCQQSP